MKDKKRMKQIASFYNSLDAHLCKSKLESEGISCVLQDEHLLSLNPFWGFAIGGIKLLVTADKEAGARQIMKGIDYQQEIWFKGLRGRNAGQRPFLKTVGLLLMGLFCFPAGLLVGVRYLISRMKNRG